MICLPICQQIYSRYFRTFKGALLAKIEAIPLSAPTSRIAKPQKEAFLSETPPFLPTFGFFPLQTSQIRRPGLKTEGRLACGEIHFAAFVPV